MTEKAKRLIDFLSENHFLSEEEYLYLIKNRNEENAEYLRQKADEARKNIYGNKIFVRGLIEISNICKNDCYYCGIRKSNKSCDRYKLNEQDILACCQNGYSKGFRTFVLQGGEGVFSVDFICGIVKKIKEKYPDTAVTLSLGEYEKSDYKKMKEAGADRYLLRHETICKEHYEKLHPKNMSYENRLSCLKILKELGFQVGSGFLVGSPYQSEEIIAKEFKFIEEFSPEMCGIGPFIPQKDTPFKNESSGTAEETSYYLSIIRLIKPNILLPSTTALGTVKDGGRELGLLSGANVLMPNLSPERERKKYTLYDNKLATGVESAEQLEKLKEQIKNIGYEIVIDKGDIKL